MTVVAGMFTPASDGRVANTLLATGPEVEESYDKIHLYDAFGFRESDTVAPGTGWSPSMSTASGWAWRRVTTCGSLNSSGRMRTGATVSVVPASWAAGPGKRAQWELLVRARALDATVWLAAVGQAPPDPQGGVPVRRSRRRTSRSPPRRPPASATPRSWAPTGPDPGRGRERPESDRRGRGHRGDRAGPAGGGGAGQPAVVGGAAWVSGREDALVAWMWLSMAAQAASASRGHRRRGSGGVRRDIVLAVARTVEGGDAGADLAAAQGVVLLAHQGVADGGDERGVETVVGGDELLGVVVAPQGVLVGQDAAISSTGAVPRSVVRSAAKRSNRPRISISSRISRPDSGAI